MTAYVPAGTCSANVTLPFPVIAENCEMSGHIAHASAAQMLTFTNDPDAGIVPANTVMSIPGLIPNAIANGVLQIKFKGDNAGPKEYFNIFQNNTHLRATIQETTSLIHQVRADDGLLRNTFFQFPEMLRQNPFPSTLQKL